MRLLVTGDRNWRNATRIYEVLESLFPLGATLIEGEAMGADIISAVVWELHFPGCPIERYPAQWDHYGPSAGPIRNKEMLGSGVEYVVGFHDNILRSRGTRNMLYQCAKAGIPGRLFTQTEEVLDWQALVLQPRS